MKPQAIIVGAGIGGLTCAALLSRSGWTVTVLEKANTPSQLGAGIQLAPNATRVLDALNVLPHLRARGHQPASLQFLRWSTGRAIAVNPLGAEAERRYGAPHLQLHRQDLHEVLLAACAGSNVRFSSAVQRVVASASGVSVVLTTGDVRSADVVIGADGIHSRVREAVAGASTPVSSGTTAYRATASAQRIRRLGLPANGLWMGPGRHLVQYWIRPDLMNIVAVVDHLDGADSWTASASTSELADGFQGWSPDVLELLMQASSVRRQGIYVRPAIRIWDGGRVCLLGDSAHAMTPFKAQGAAQAIMDAQVVAEELIAEPDDVPVALGRYAARRTSPASTVAQASAAAGHDYHLADGPEADARDARLRSRQHQFPFGDDLVEHEKRTPKHEPRSDLARPARR